MTANTLDGKVAIVTGGASGMGAATVALFAEQGARVICTDVDVDKGQAVAAATGARFVRQDVSDQSSFAELGRIIGDDYGRLDVMVNNAGIIVNNPIDEFDVALWQRVIGINLNGPVFGCHFAIGMMRNNPGGSSGSIINVASTTAIAAVPNDVGYVASKGGVRSMSRSVAVLCARNGYAIRSNCVIPGAIDTGITDRAVQRSGDAVRERLAKMSPLGRIGQGSDIAQAMLFLASDGSTFVTGTDILVDGGALALHPGY